MISRDNHIAPANTRQRSSRKISFLLACAISLFLSTTISAQVINNEGAVISVKQNTVVVSGELQNTANTIENEGTIELSSHFVNQDITDSDGVIKLAGDWTNNGIFNEGTGRVEFRGNQLQSLSSTEVGGETFHSLMINKDNSSMSNLVDLANDVTVTDSLRMNSGIVNANPANTLDLLDQSAGSLVYNDGSNSRVIGKFERGVGSEDKYLFPVGSDENYNPLHLDPTEPLASSGSVLSEFIKADPGTAGLPIDDDSVEIYSVIRDGYWSLTARNGFTSNRFDMDMDGAGFSDSTAVQDISRIIKRPAGNDWTVDGDHINGVGTVGNRVDLTGGISNSGNHFAFGHPRPRIFDQPRDTTECDSTGTFFSTFAQGARPLYYEWYEKPPLGGWTSLTNTGIYSGTDSPILTFSEVYLWMHLYEYRVKITHKHGHVKWSDIVTLNVDELPDAFINPTRDTICSEGSTNFLVTSHIPVTRYHLDNLSFGAVAGSDTTLTGTLPGPIQIIQTLSNLSNFVDSVRYRATPYGAGLARCKGHDGIAKVLVNPTPRILSNRTPIDTLFCNDRSIDFDLSNLVTTTGTVHYDLNLFGDTVDFNGHWNPTNNLVPVEPGADFSNTLSHEHDLIREISYRFEPFINDAYGGTVKTVCYGGIADTVTVRMVPVLSAVAFPDTTVVNEDALPGRSPVRVGGHAIQCFGDSNGATNISVAGGDYRSVYHYVWRDSITENLLRENLINPIDRLENQSIGIYTYEITDTIGCNLSGSFELTQPEVLLGIDSVAQPLCADTYTGNIFMDVSGGIEGYLYAWKNLKTQLPPQPEGTHDLFDVRSGSYSYTLTDTNSCVFIDTFTINKTDELETEVWKVSEPSLRYNLKCIGDSDGLVSAKTVAQTAKHPVSYAWYDESDNLIGNDSTISDLTAGMYYAVIIDGNGCEDPDGNLVYEIREPDSIRFEKMNMPFASGWDISCFEMDDGVLDIKYTGGNIDTLTNTFVWSTIDGSGLELSDSLQSGLTAGEYKVIIEDFLECKDSTVFTLAEPDPFQLDLDTSLYTGGRNIRCFDEANGSIYVNSVMGGGTTTETGIYTYNWTPPDGFSLPNGPTAEDQDNLIAGLYELLITDQIGCDTSTTIELTEPAILLADTLIDRVGATLDKNGFAIQCFGDNNGEISLIPAGGTRAYSYDWFDSTRFDVITADTLVQDLYQGIYSVKITDINGCDTSYRFALNEPDTIVLNPIIDSIYCFGGTATIHLNPEGGNGLYTYEWEDGSTGQNYVNFPAGTYGVEVTDENNCTIPDSLTLVQNAEIIPTIQVTSEYNGRDISCHDAEDGIVQVYVEPGNRIYHYEWSNGVTDSDLIENVSAGDYSVEIVDNFGCDTFISITVVSPPQLTVLIEALDPLCYGIPTGEITLFPEGGTPFPIAPAYAFNWSNPLFSGDQLSELPEGIYTLSLSDVNDCQIDTTISLVEPDPLLLEFETTLAECRDEANGSIDITLIDGGTAPYTTEIDGTQDNFFDYLVPGDYLIVLTDANGCIREDTATVLPERESCLELPNAFTPNGDGSNDTWILDEDADGTTDMIYYLEAELRIYNRWGVLIYYTNNVAYEPWDGTFNGRDMPIDSYHYILDLNNGDPPVLGNVTIIR